MIEMILLILFLPAGLSLRQTPDIFGYEGENVTLECSQVGTSYNGMYWFRQRYGKSLEHIVYYYVNMETLEDGFKQKASAVRKGSSLDLLMKVIQSSDSGVYFCAKQEPGQGFSELAFGPGTRLTVLDPTINISIPNVELLPPSPKQLCQTKNNENNVTLLCVVTEFYPDHVNITWQVNKKKRTLGVETDTIADKDPKTRLYKMTSRLNVKPSEWTDIKNNFTCVVSFYDGKTYEKYGDTIKYKPGLLPVRVFNTVHFSYWLIVCKSLVYAGFVTAVVWKGKIKTEKELPDED